MNPKQAIQKIGLDDKEARAYLSLLQLGVSSAQKVAEESGLKRSTTYVILGQLKEKGAVSLVPDAKKKMYRPVTPEKLFEKAEKEISKARDALPEIKALENTGSEKPNAIFFEGHEGVKEALNYRLEDLKDKEMVAFYAKSDEDILKSFNYFEDYNNKLKELNISARGIAPKDENLDYFRQVDEEYNRQIKVLSQNDYSSTVSIEITKDFVRILDPNNLQGLIIENESIAQTLNEIFELVWECKNK
ncbi:MAG: TrmB family transcriptional regulator [Candidatus Magasanikbacteria bacterium]